MTPDDLQQHRPYLLRYALLQLRDPTAAEDVVQETLLAALTGLDRFSGQSTLRTWLTGILKHKIIDTLRRQAREQPLTADDEQSETEAVDALFADDGHWRQFPADWGDPEKALENSKFREVFELCAQHMPVRLARAFTLREVMELSTEEICKELSVTQTNLWVMLHRARLLLRECINTKWFDGKHG